MAGSRSKVGRLQIKTGKRKQGWRLHLDALMLLYSDLTWLISEEDIHPGNTPGELYNTRRGLHWEGLPKKPRLKCPTSD